MGLAHPPFHLLVPSFVALVPLIVWLEELPDTAESHRQARIGGFFFGLVYYTLVFHWLLVALIFYTWMALFAFLAPIIILSFFMSGMVAAVHSVRVRLRWPIWAVFPIFWTANEWLRASLPQIAFPWMQLGDTLTNYPWLIGAADLVGSRGLSLWLALINTLVALGFLAYRSGGIGRLLRPALALALTFTLAIGYSLIRSRNLELRPVASVGVVQPNVPQHIKLEDPAVATDSALRASEALVRPWIEKESLDLVLFPETMLQVYLDPIPSFGFAGSPAVDYWVTSLAESLDADVVVGALGVKNQLNANFVPFNSAFHFHPERGRISQYDKRFLVPMVERVPFIPPEWLAGIPYMSGSFGVGELALPIEIDAERGPASFGTMICYESIFSPLARHYRRNGADFLVNITNDSWFGREVWWSRSSGLSQHPAHLVMRAIETRMGVARSSNTGISEIVDPLGRVSHETELFKSAAFVADVYTTDVETLFVKYGDVAGTGAMIAAIFSLCVSISAARKSDAGIEA